MERERAKAEAEAAAAAAAAAAKQLAMQAEKRKPSRSRRMRRRMSRRSRSPAPGGGPHTGTPSPFVPATDTDTPRSNPSRGGTDGPTNASPSPRRMVKELKWSDQVAKPAAQHVDDSHDGAGPEQPPPAAAGELEAAEDGGSDSEAGVATEQHAERPSTAAPTPTKPPGSALRKGGIPRASSAGATRAGDRRAVSQQRPETAGGAGDKPAKVGWSPLQVRRGRH